MSRLTVVVNQWQDEDGRTFPKGKLYTYEVGSNTLKSTFSDAALTSPNANPLEADGSGRLFSVFMASGGYRIEWRDQFDNVIWEQDDYYATVDGTDLLNLENDIQANSEAITENIASYSCTNAGDDYSLTVLGGFDAPKQYRQGAKILFTPSATNVGGSPTVDIEVLGTVQLRDYTNTSIIPDNFLDTSREYMFEYSGSTFKFLWRSGLIVNDDITAGTIGYDKIISGTQNRILIYGLGGVLEQTTSGISNWEIVQTVDLTNGGANDLTEVEFLNIPASATMIKIRAKDVSFDVADTVFMQFGNSTAYINSGYSGNTADTAGNTASWSTAINTSAFSPIGAADTGKYSYDFEEGDDNEWYIKGRFVRSDGLPFPRLSLGDVDVTDELTRIKFYSALGNNFDGGSLTIMIYQGVST